MHKFYSSVFIDKSEALHGEAYKITPWRRQICGYIIIIFGCLFAAFIFVPETAWEGLRSDICFKMIYPKYLEHLLENNIIKKTLFPMSAYIFWAVMPLFIITNLSLCIFLLLPFREFEFFLVRRRNGKNILLTGFSVVLLYIGVLHIEELPSILNSVLKPFEYKFSFFMIYCGAALGFSGAIALLAMECRARLHLSSSVVV
jgi:hypothetical protein